MNAVSAVGLLLQGVGGVVALWGLVKTHDAYAEKTLRTIGGERMGRVRDRAVALLRRLIGRRSGRTVEASVAMGGGGAFNARAVIAYGPISGHVPLRQAINMLDERLRHTQDRLTRVEGSVEELGDETRGELTKLREQVLREATTLRDIVRHAAIEGLMTEAVGLVMVTIGAVLQGVGSFGASGG